VTSDSMVSVNTQVKARQMIQEIVPT